VYDFGEVWQHETLTAECRVTNHHPTPVEVLDVIKSCSCADADLSPRTIPPGGSATLRFAWRTAGKRGRVGDTVTLGYRTGGANAGVAWAEVRLAATVRPDVIYAPEVAEFTAGTPGTREVVFQPGRDGITVRVDLARTSSDAFGAEVLPGGRTVRLTYDPSRPLITGIQHSTLVRVVMPREEWVTIPITMTRSNP
jgi:hypothetical protein